VLTLETAVKLLSCWIRFETLAGASLTVPLWLARMRGSPAAIAFALRVGDTWIAGRTLVAALRRRYEQKEH
jgi:hypothetical protein